MIESLIPQLEEWKNDSKVLGVLIKGQGRAFCAGGDIRALAGPQSTKENIEKFFEKEYTLDSSLYTYPKPLMVWAHGITMGGGMGIMQGAKFRMVTDSTRLAMPEISIGLFPDVGASYFLKKVPNAWGLFLAVTGVRLKANEAVQLKMADFWLRDEELMVLQTDLNTFKANTPESFETELKTWIESKMQKATGGDIFAHADFVDATIKHTNAKSLTTWAKTYTPKDEWENLLIKNILAASPTSLGLIYAIWERAKTWEMPEAFYNEWFVAANCGIKGDFAEGVRALLVDKDNKPQWKPASTEELSADYLDSYFVSPRVDKKNPLEYLIK